MTETASGIAAEIDIYRQQAGITAAVIGMNVAGVTHAESLMCPQPAGNCLNWVMGHVLWVYNQLLPMLGQAPVMPGAELDVYARGSAPLTDSGLALEFGVLLERWAEAATRMDAGLAALTDTTLDQPGLQTVGATVDESFRVSLTSLLFHQAYHAGQTGIIRRLIGKDGAIR